MASLRPFAIGSLILAAATLATAQPPVPPLPAPAPAAVPAAVPAPAPAPAQAPVVSGVILVQGVGFLDLVGYHLDLGHGKLLVRLNGQVAQAQVINANRIMVHLPPATTQFSVEVFFGPKAVPFAAYLGGASPGVLRVPRPEFLLVPATQGPDGLKWNELVAAAYGFIIPPGPFWTGGPARPATPPMDYFLDPANARLTIHWVTRHLARWELAVAMQLCPRPGEVVPVQALLRQLAVDTHLPPLTPGHLHALIQTLNNKFRSAIPAERTFMSHGHWGSPAEGYSFEPSNAMAVWPQGEPAPMPAAGPSSVPAPMQAAGPSSVPAPMPASPSEAAASSVTTVPGPKPRRQVFAYLVQFLGEDPRLIHVLGSGFQALPPGRSLTLGNLPCKSKPLDDAHLVAELPAALAADTTSLKVGSTGSARLLANLPLLRVAEPADLLQHLSRADLRRIFGEVRGLQSEATAAAH